VLPTAIRSRCSGQGPLGWTSAVGCLRHCFEQLDQLVPAYPMLASDSGEFFELRDHVAPASCRRRNRDPTAPSELQKPFISKQSKRPENGVLIDTKHCRQVSGRREPIAGTTLAIGDSSPNLGGNLIVEGDRL